MFYELIGGEVNKVLLATFICIRRGSHVVEYHTLELLKCDLVAVVDVVLVHDFVDLLVGEMVAHLRECFTKCHGAQLVRLLRVKLLEEGL